MRASRLRTLAACAAVVVLGVAPVAHASGSCTASSPKIDGQTETSCSYMAAGRGYFNAAVNGSWEIVHYWVDNLGKAHTEILKTGDGPNFGGITPPAGHKVIATIRSGTGVIRVGDRPVTP